MRVLQLRPLPMQIPQYPRPHILRLVRQPLTISYTIRTAVQPVGAGQQLLPLRILRFRTAGGAVVGAGAAVAAGAEEGGAGGREGCEGARVLVEVRFVVADLGGEFAAGGGGDVLRLDAEGVQLPERRGLGQ